MDEIVAEEETGRAQEEEEKLDRVEEVEAGSGSSEEDA